MAHWISTVDFLPLVTAIISCSAYRLSILMPSHGCLRTAREFSTAVQRVTAGQYWQQSWCEPVSTLCSNVSVFIVSPLIFRWRHQSCNLGGKPVIFSFPLCSLSFISNVSRTRKVVAVQTPCLGLWLYCQRAASLHDVKWQLLCVCFVFTSLPASPLRSASLDSALSPGMLLGCDLFGAV